MLNTHLDTWLNLSDTITDVLFLSRIKDPTGSESPHHCCRNATPQDVQEPKLIRSQRDDDMTVP